LSGFMSLSIQPNQTIEELTRTTQTRHSTSCVCFQFMYPLPNFATVHFRLLENAWGVLKLFDLKSDRNAKKRVGNYDTGKEWMTIFDLINSLV